MALGAVKVVLLAVRISVSYRVAYGATGWVNRQLITVVGRSIVWCAYSWVPTRPAVTLTASVKAPIISTTHSGQTEFYIASTTNDG